MGGHPSGITNEIEDLKLHITRTADATPFNLDSAEIRADESWRVIRIVARNRTSVSSSIRFLTVRESKPHLFQEQLVATADVLYWTDEKFWAMPGEKIRVTFTGINVGDGLDAYVWGFKKRKVYK